MMVWFLPLAGSPTVKNHGRKDESGKTLQMQARIDSIQLFFIHTSSFQFAILLPCPGNMTAFLLIYACRTNHRFPRR